jgi:hypothetical protein
VNRCLAEGRKSFLARYAGIETGEECRRWAPVLSAMVDGEATAEQLMELRPHLRNCAGCRAALRELRGSNAPLAALFPVGSVALLGDDRGFGGVPELVSRLWHSLWGDLSERAATAAFRAQSMAHAILPGKSIAIVASVATLAGGGYAIDEAVRTPPRTALHVPTVSPAADLLTTKHVTPLVRPAQTTAASTARPRTRPKRSPRRRPRVPRRRSVAATVRPAPAVRATAARPAGTSAAPRPTASTPPVTVPEAALSRRAAPPSSAPRTRPRGIGEFGLETR